MSAKTTARLLVLFAVCLFVTAAIGTYVAVNNTTDINQIKHQIVPLVKSPCQKDADSRACINLRIRVTKAQPRRVACLTVEQAGYTCRKEIR